MRRFRVTIHAPSRRSSSLHTESAGAAPPDAFGPFRVLHQSGAGTLGPVFRAYDSTRERLVAVKLFKLDLPPERGHQLLAEFETLIAANLTHPAVAAPLAAGISDVSAFLVQDYVAADSLDLAVREYGPAPAADALRVVTQLAAALDFAAAAGVTHGALHPRDVLLSTDDTRVTGLGVTRALERIGVVAPVRRPYSAPERIAGGDWDRRADVFSLAALIHELFWGRRVSGIGAQAAEGLTEIAGADLAALRATFARALAENPDARFETATQFAEALKAACPGIVVAPVPAKTAKRRAPRDIEPTLPLEPEVEEPAPPVAPEPSPAVVQEPSPDVVHDFSRAVPFADVEEDLGPADLSIAPAMADMVINEPVFERDVEHQIVREAAPVAAPQVEPYEPSMAIPAGLITSHDPEPLSALEVSRTAIWPLALALVVGMAVGFGGGFFVGSRQEPAAPPVTLAVAPAGREFTESAVPAASAAAPKPASPNAELRTQSSEPNNLKSEISNPKSHVAEGRLLVRSRPAGAAVVVDGRAYGKTPVTVRDLTRGAHRMTVSHDGYARYERRVVVTASRPSQNLTIALVKARAGAPARTAPAAAAAKTTGALAVESRPAGAKVFVDGKLVGTTPMSMPTVAAGAHAIRLERDGYRRWSGSVSIVAGEPNRVTASLER